MKILAIEFSTEQRSAAVVDGDLAGPGALLGEARSDRREVGGLTLVEQALALARCEREQIGCIAIGIGPGSYTGIRVAIALAQGWQLARGVDLVAVSGIECLAEQARREHLFGKVSLVVDAQRQEFYLARYCINEAAAGLLEPLRLATRAEVDAASGAGDVLAGPEVTRWFPGGRTLVPSAAILGQLAAQRRDFVGGDALEPIYLREVSFVKAPPARVIP